MKITLENIDWTKIRGILIIIIFLLMILIKKNLESYRGTWIYHYGGPLSLFISFGCTFLSFVNTILLISKYKTELRKNLLWIFLSAIPFLYLSILLTIGMIISE